MTHKILVSSDSTECTAVSIMLHCHTENICMSSLTHNVIFYLMDATVMINVCDGASDNYFLSFALIVMYV